MPKLRPGLKRMVSGNWQGRVKIDGKTLTSSSPDRATVERWMDEQQARRRDRTYGGNPLGIRTPVAELWDDYRETRKLKPRSLKRYESLWTNHLRPRWGRMAVGDVNKVDVQRWINRDLAHLSPATVEGCVTLLQGICRVAVDYEWIVRNPVTGVKRPEIARPEPEIPTIDEMFALIDATPVYLWPMIVFGAACGMRFGEAAGVLLRDLHLDDNPYVAVDEQLHPDGSRAIPKSRGAGRYARRRAPLPAWAVEYLRAYLARYPRLPDALVSERASGGQMYADIFDYHFRRAQVRVYGEDRGFTHKTLRHWNISERRAAGESEPSIQRTVGHEPGSRVTSASYTHATAISEDQTRAVLDGLARGRRVAEGSKRVRKVL